MFSYKSVLIQIKRTKFTCFSNSGCITTIFSWFHRYAKYSSLRNQKRVVRGALLCPVLPFIYEVSALILQIPSFVTDFFRNFAEKSAKLLRLGINNKHV